MIRHRDTIFLVMLALITCTALMTILTITTQDATPVLPVPDEDLLAPINITTPARLIPLITLFTTFKYSAEKNITFRNTIRNWGLLAPVVRPVLYHAGGEAFLSEFARKHGWSVYVYPRVSKSGVPILRSMFHHVKNLTFTNKTLFYGYANADILFDRSLLASLEALKREHERDGLKNMFVIGRRINYRLRRDQELFNLASVSQSARSGALFTEYAQDYFITTHSGFDWDSIPDFVVGRVGYDNWLVATAFKRNMTVIDVTATLTALHQTGADGISAGWHLKLNNRSIFENYRLAGDLNFATGCTCGAHFIAKWHNSRVIIVKRPPSRK